MNLTLAGGFEAALSLTWTTILQFGLWEEVGLGVCASVRALRA